MSWDLFAMRLPPDVRSVDEIAADYEVPAVGPRSEVVAAVEAVVAADFSDPSWGVIETAHASIEVSLGRDEIVDSVALHVRGGGDEVLVLIADLLDALGLRAIDGSTGDFFDAVGSRQGWAEWQRYRDRAIGDAAAD